MEIVKGGLNGNHNVGGDSGQVLSGDLPEKVFIVQVINYKGDVGYMGQDKDGKSIILPTIVPLVIKFGDYKNAKTYAATIKGAKTDILGKGRIEKILMQQVADQDNKTVPLDKVEGSMYKVIVKTITGEMVGYISYKMETDEYSVITKEEGSAFWDKEDVVDNFMKVAKETFLSQHKDLVLEKIKVK